MRNNFLYNNNFKDLPEKMRQGDIGGVVKDVTDFYMDNYSLPTDCNREPEEGQYDDDWNTDEDDAWDYEKEEEDE